MHDFPRIALAMRALVRDLGIYRCAPTCLHGSQGLLSRRATVVLASRRGGSVTRSNQQVKGLSCLAVM